MNREARKKKILKENFKKPNVTSYLNEYFIMKQGNQIRKDEFLRNFNAINKSNVPWGWLLNQLQRNHIEYNNQAVLNNCIGGSIIGLDYKDDILGLSFYDFE